MTSMQTAGGADEETKLWNSSHEGIVYDFDSGLCGSDLSDDDIEVCPQHFYSPAKNVSRAVDFFSWRSG